MFTIIKMQARSILRNPASFFIVVFPLILVPVLTSVAVFGFENGLLQTFTDPAQVTQATEEFNSVLAIVLSSVIAITILAAINNSFGSNFMELKKSIIIKRLGSTQVTKTNAMLGFLLWAVLLATVQVLYTVFLFWIVDVSGLLEVSSAALGTINGTFFNPNIDWLSVIYGLIMLMLVSFAMTFFFMSIATNAETYQIMAFFYFFLVMYFGGLIFTANVQWMNIVSLFLPHTYVAGFLNGAFNGHYVISGLNDGLPINIWDMSNYSDDYILNGVSSLNVIMPIIFTGAFGYIGIKNFRWDS